MADYKDNVKRALARYATREAKKLGVRRINNSPEKDMVKDGIMPWLKSNGFSCHVIEAKAVYSQSIGRYMHSQAVPGMSDIVGNDADGIASYIEAKAPGRRSVIKDKRHEHQKAFLIDKINTNCFAVCVDSPKLLSIYYSTFKKFKDLSDRRSYLLSLLC